MEPRSFNRGNAPGLWTGRPVYWSFNGAAVFQPRKLHEPEDGCSVSWSASMEPRSFNRGNCRKSKTAARLTTGFNGAAVFQPRKQERLLDRERFEDCFNGAA